MVLCRMVKSIGYLMLHIGLLSGVYELTSSQQPTCQYLTTYPHQYPATSQYPATNKELLQTTNITVRRNTSTDDSFKNKKNIYWEVFRISAHIILFIIGVIGNVLTAITIILTNTLQNLQNYFVFSLAVTDLVTLLIVLPLIMIRTYMSWPFGDFTCKYILSIADVLPAVSILMLVAISIDRYRVIVHDISRPPSLKVGVILIVIIWVVTYLVVGLPLTFTFTVGAGHWVSKNCFTQWTNKTNKKIYFISRTIFFYVLPCVVIFYCYLRVNKTLGKNLNFVARSLSGYARVAGLKRQKRVMNMFFVIFVTFVLCFFPLNLTVLLSLLSTEVESWKHFGEFFQLSMIFGLTNSILNPIILYKLSRHYRDNFRKYLPFLKRFKYTKDQQIEDGEDEVQERYALVGSRHMTK